MSGFAARVLDGCTPTKGLSIITHIIDQSLSLFCICYAPYIGEAGAAHPSLYDVLFSTVYIDISTSYHILLIFCA